MAVPILDVADAAALLGMPVSGVEALLEAGFLHTESGPGRAILLTELKAFQARNVPGGDDGPGDVLVDIGGLQSGADAILDALEASIASMAGRAADIVSTVFPDAANWTDAERADFERQSAGRFEAILAVTRRSDSIEDDLVADLVDAGGAAAFAGASLPQILMTLRISRDLMVQTAVTAAEERGRHWGLALVVVLTRVLPVLDRLVDSVARGYWEAVIMREQETFARFKSVVEHSASGIYELDLDGCLTYCNESMAAIVGRDRSHLEGEYLQRLLAVVGAGSPTPYATPTEEDSVELVARRVDGIERRLSLRVTERRVDGLLMGHDGVVGDVTAERDLEYQKNDFLALMTQELRQPLTTILGLGATLDSHAEVLPADRLHRMGRSIYNQASRISRLADDLYDVSRIQSNVLVLAPRVIELGPTVEAGLALLPDTGSVFVDIEPDLYVLADARRLEQVVAHLVENALLYGEAPVALTARAAGDDLTTIVVSDAGPGIAASEVETIFARLRPTDEGMLRRDRTTGLGLPLSRGLIEAMGGRLSYRSTASGGAAFEIALAGHVES